MSRMNSILYSGIARLKMTSWRAVMTSTSTQRTVPMFLRCAAVFHANSLTLLDLVFRSFKRQSHTWTRFCLTHRPRSTSFVASPNPSRPWKLKHRISGSNARASYLPKNVTQSYQRKYKRTSNTMSSWTPLQGDSTLLGLEMLFVAKISQICSGGWTSAWITWRRM